MPRLEGWKSQIIIPIWLIFVAIIVTIVLKIIG